MELMKERSQFKAGLFIIISTVLILGVTIAIKGVSVIFQPLEQRRVRFTLRDDVGGLRIGDDVRIGGYKVGVIQRIELQGLGDGQTPSLVVVFSIPKQYPLHTNAHLMIQTQVTGSSVLNIDDMGSGQLLLASNELAGNASVFTSLEASVADAVPEVRSIITDVKAQTLPKANDTLVSFKQSADTINGYLGDTKPDFRGTMSNLNAITKDTKAKLPGIMDHADAFIKQVNDNLEGARGTLEDLKVAIANVKNITATARDVVAGNKSRLDNIIAGLKASSDNLKGATAEIRRSPWRILYHPGPGEMDNLELYDAARQFADGANNVNDAALALRDALANPNTDRAQLQKLMEQLNTSFTGFNAVEQKLWKAVKP